MKEAISTQESRDAKLVPVNNYKGLAFVQQKLMHGVGRE